MVNLKKLARLIGLVQIQELLTKLVLLLFQVETEVTLQMALSRVSEKLVIGGVQK